MLQTSSWGEAVYTAACSSQMASLVISVLEEGCGGQNSTPSFPSTSFYFPIPPQFFLTTTAFPTALCATWGSCVDLLSPESMPCHLCLETCSIIRL